MGHVSDMFCGVEEALTMFGIALELGKGRSRSSKRHVLVSLRRRVVSRNPEWENSRR